MYSYKNGNVIIDERGKSVHLTVNRIHTKKNLQIVNEYLKKRFNNRIEIKDDNGNWKIFKDGRYKEAFDDKIYKWRVIVL